MQDFDAYWNYSDSKATEEKFREILSSAQDINYIAELKTQIARTLGLQRKFEDGHLLLSEIENDLIQNNPQIATRYYLEKGRLYNSNNEKADAIKMFEKATDIANKNELDFYHLDALHMLGIATTDEVSLAWNEKAIDTAEKAKEERAKNWLGSLYNNTGWTYFDMKNYEKATALFHKCLFWNIDKQRDANARIAKYSIAKCKRMMQKNDEALFILHEIEGVGDDGYIYEELAENYLVKNELEKSKTYFQKTYELLHTDIWLQANEKERIDRWKANFE